MKYIERQIPTIFISLVIVLATTSCSVQQFAVNTEVKPFENKGKIFGERTKDMEFRKSWDLHLLGINIRKSDVGKLAQEMNATSYTIETKSNLYVDILTCGFLDCKIVKVIKRDN
jgi:hypothetical protein